MATASFVSMDSPPPFAGQFAEVYDESGNLINDQFGPYHIYRADEMPWMQAILVQTNEPTGPFGAKAIAEIPKDGVAPAIANAIYDATGTRLHRIPLTPQRVAVFNLAWVQKLLPK